MLNKSLAIDYLPGEIRVVAIREIDECHRI